jgi:hypothetical protein
MWGAEVGVAARGRRTQAQRRLGQREEQPVEGWIGVVGRMTRRKQRVGRSTGGSWWDLDTGTPYDETSTQGRHTDGNGGLAYGEQWHMCSGSRHTRRPEGGRRREWCRKEQSGVWGLRSTLCPRSLAAPSGVSSAIMDVSLITPPPALSSSLTASSFGYRVPTLPRRTARPSAWFVPPMMSCAPYCSKLLFQPVTGVRAFTLPPTSSTSFTETLAATMQP